MSFSFAYLYHVNMNAAFRYGLVMYCNNVSKLWLNAIFGGLTKKGTLRLCNMRNVSFICIIIFYIFLSDSAMTSILLKRTSVPYFNAKQLLKFDQATKRRL